MTYPVTTKFHLISAATTNATVVRSTSTQLFGITLSNSNAAARYFKLYNKGTAPVVGTDVPVVTILVPAGGTINIDRPGDGAWYNNGLSFATTTGIADTDATAVGLNDLAINLIYV